MSKGPNTAGSGGRVRHGLKGRGPTPKAEDRVYHKAYQAKQGRAENPSASGSRREAAPSRRPSRVNGEWVVGRNPVLEALLAGLPVRTAYIADGVERDDRLQDILKYTAAHSMAMLQVTRAELDRLTGGAVHQGVALLLGF